MAIGRICSSEVVCIGRGESIADAARLMRKHHVGSLVVVEERDCKRLPVGMLTDRDIAIGVVALDVDPARTPVEGAMRADLVSVRDDEGIGQAVSLMRSQCVRRLPVVDAAGALVGIVAADDLMMLFADEISGVAAIIDRGELRERALRTAVA